MRCLVVIRSREQTEANTQIPTYVCQDIMYVATCTEDGGWAAAAIAESLFAQGLNATHCSNAKHLSWSRASSGMKTASQYYCWKHAACGMCRKWQRPVWVWHFFASPSKIRTRWQKGWPGDKCTRGHWSWGFPKWTVLSAEVMLVWQLPGTFLPWQLLCAVISMLITATLVFMSSG